MIEDSGRFDFLLPLAVFLLLFLSCTLLSAKLDDRGGRGILLLSGFLLEFVDFAFRLETHSTRFNSILGFFYFGLAINLDPNGASIFLSKLKDIFYALLARIH